MRDSRLWLDGRSRLSQGIQQVQLITRVLVSMQGLYPIQANLQVSGQLDLFQVNGYDVLAFIEGQVDFSIAVIRFERTRRDVEQDVSSPK